MQDTLQTFKIDPKDLTILLDRIENIVSDLDRLVLQHPFIKVNPSLSQEIEQGIHGFIRVSEKIELLQKDLQKS
jgi:hypothetical protein